jgi:hypothetical protein
LHWHTFLIPGSHACLLSKRPIKAGSYLDSRIRESDVLFKMTVQNVVDAKKCREVIVNPVPRAGIGHEVGRRTVHLRNR